MSDKAQMIQDALEKLTAADIGEFVREYNSVQVEVRGQNAVLRQIKTEILMNAFVRPDMTPGERTLSNDILRAMGVGSLQEIGAAGIERLLEDLAPEKYRKYKSEKDSRSYWKVHGSVNPFSDASNDPEFTCRTILGRTLHYNDRLATRYIESLQILKAPGVFLLTKQEAETLAQCGLFVDLYENREICGKPSFKAWASNSKYFDAEIQSPEKGMESSFWDYVYDRSQLAYWTERDCLRLVVTKDANLEEICNFMFKNNFTRISS